MHYIPDFMKNSLAYALTQSDFFVKMDRLFEAKHNSLLKQCFSTSPSPHALVILYWKQKQYFIDDKHFYVISGAHHFTIPYNLKCWLECVLT